MRRKAIITFIVAAILVLLCVDAICEDIFTWEQFSKRVGIDLSQDPLVTVEVESNCPIDDFPLYTAVDDKDEELSFYLVCIPDDIKPSEEENIYFGRINTTSIVLKKENKSFIMIIPMDDNSLIKQVYLANNFEETDETRLVNITFVEAVQVVFDYLFGEDESDEK